MTSPSDDLVKRIETQIAMDSPRGREVYQEAVDEIKLLRAELAEAKRELETMRTAGMIEVAIRNMNVRHYMNHWEHRAEQAEAARDRFAAVIGWCYCGREIHMPNGAMDIVKEAIARHRAKQEEEQSRG